MPRLPMPQDTDGFSDETRAAVRQIQETRGSLPPPSTYLAYAGEVADKLAALSGHLRYHTSLTDAEAELAICAAARSMNLDFIWNAHVKLGLAAGTREEAIHAVDTFGPLDGLTDDEALIITYSRELLETKQVQDATFEAVRQRWGEKGALELAAVMGVYLMNATILRAVGHPPAEGSRLLTPRA